MRSCPTIPGTVAANTRLSALTEKPAGEAGHEVSDTIVIRISDSTGRALADVPVSWVALDGGRAEAIDARSDSLGEAHARWKLGPKAGVQRLRAQVGSGHGKSAVPPLLVRATAHAGVAVGLVIVSGDGQRGTLGAPHGGQRSVGVLLDAADAERLGVGMANHVEIHESSVTPAPLSPERRGEENPRPDSSRLPHGPHRDLPYATGVVVTYNKKSLRNWPPTQRSCCSEINDP